MKFIQGPDGRQPWLIWSFNSQYINCLVIHFCLHCTSELNKYFCLVLSYLVIYFCRYTFVNIQFYVYSKISILSDTYQQWYKFRLYLINVHKREYIGLFRPPPYTFTITQWLDESPHHHAGGAHATFPSVPSWRRFMNSYQRRIFTETRIICSCFSHISWIILGWNLVHFG